MLYKTFRKFYVEDRHGALSGWLSVRWSYLKLLGALDFISKDSFQLTDIVFLTWRDEGILLSVLKSLKILYKVIDVPVGKHRFVALFSYNGFDRLKSYVKAPSECSIHNKKVPLKDRKKVITNFEGNYFFRHPTAGSMSCRPLEEIYPHEIERYPSGHKKRRGRRAGTVFEVYQIPDNVVDVNDIWAYVPYMVHFGAFCMEHPFTLKKFKYHVTKVFLDYTEMIEGTSEREIERKIDIYYQAERYKFKHNMLEISKQQEAAIHKEFTKKLDFVPPIPPFEIKHGRKETVWDRIFEGMK